MDGTTTIYVRKLNKETSPIHCGNLSMENGPTGLLGVRVIRSFLLILSNIIKTILTFSAWFSLKGHTYLRNLQLSVQVCLSMRDLSLDTRHQRFNIHTE